MRRTTQCQHKPECNHRTTSNHNTSRRDACPSMSTESATDCMNDPNVPKIGMEWKDGATVILKGPVCEILTQLMPSKSSPPCVLLSS